MTPNTIICGDALAELRKLPDESVDCCITSPPYWGLRDYGVAGQLGLEKTPEAFVESMVAVFREVRRVLADHGTLWLNIGDSYAGSGRGRDADGEWNPGKGGSKQETNKGAITGRVVNAKSLSRGAIEAGVIGNAWVKPPPGIKAKDLVGIPWMLAFALRADGWYLRQDIIWAKPNPMPESVTDRCTKAHEYIFMLSKSAKYYYDAEAIKTESKDAADDLRRYGQQIQENKSAPTSMKNGIRPRTPVPSGWNTGNGSHSTREHNTGDKQRGHSRRHAGFNDRWDSMSREEQVARANKRTVWSVATMPFKEAHFATFPEKLIEPMILAGAPPPRHYFGPVHGCGDHRTRRQKARQAISRYRAQSGIHKDGREAHREHSESPLLI